MIVSQLSTMNFQLFCGLDATKKIPGEGFKRAWPPCGDEARGERRPTLIQMDESVKAKVEKLLKS